MQASMENYWKRLCYIIIDQALNYADIATKIFFNGTTVYCSKYQINWWSKNKNWCRENNWVSAVIFIRRVNEIRDAQQYIVVRAGKNSIGVAILLLLDLCNTIIGYPWAAWAILLILISAAIVLQYYCFPEIVVGRAKNAFN